MVLTNCKKGMIYSAEDSQIVICEIAVTSIHNDYVTIVIDDIFMDDLEAEMAITFFDETHGLVTYKCALSNPKRYLSDDRIWMQSLHCILSQEISVQQRRSDYKARVSIDAEVAVPADMEISLNEPYIIRHGGTPYIKITIMNLSAGGVYFETPVAFTKHSILSLRLPLDGKAPLILNTHILRMDTPQDRSLHNPHIKDDDGLFGYGCKFEKIPSSSESSIRSFAFKQQMRFRESAKRR